MSQISRDLIEQGASPPDKGTPEWNDLVARLSEQLGYTICGAIKRKTRWPCESAPMINGKCRIHGGKNAPPGPDHPAVTVGRYSKALQGLSIAEAYEQARNDPELLSLNEEISVLVARQKQLLHKLATTGESRNAWNLVALNMQKMHEAYQNLTGAEEGKQMRAALARMRSIMETIFDITEKGLQEFGIWDEYDRNTAQLRKLVLAEHKRRETMQLFFPAERANLMQMIMTEAVRRTVPPEYIPALRAELARLRMQSGPETSGRNVGNLLAAG